MFLIDPGADRSIFDKKYICLTTPITECNSLVLAANVTQISNIDQIKLNIVINIQMV